MARFPYLDPDDLPPEHRRLLDRPINLMRELAHSPEGARAFGVMGGFIRRGSKLDPRLREMAILQVGYLARAPYEWSHHVEIGREFGVSDTDIAAIGPETAGESTSLEPLARAVLQAAREMTDGVQMSDATWEELHAALDRESLTDLVLTIAYYNAVVRILATLQIDVEPGYLHYLDEFPLPSA